MIDLKKRLAKLKKKPTKNLNQIIRLAMTSVAVVTLIVFATTITAVIRDTLIANSKTATEQSVNLSYLYLKNYHDQLRQKGSIIADEIQQTDPNNRLDKMREIYQMNQDVVSVNLYELDGKPVMHAPLHYLTKNNSLLFEKEWYQEKASPYSFQFSLPHLQDLYQTVPIQVVSIYQQIRLDGQPYILLVDYDFDSVSDFLSRVVIDDKGYVYIADNEGRVIYHPFPVRHASEEKTSVEELIHKGDGTFVTENERYTVGHRTISNLGWHIVGVSYLEDSLDPALNSLYLNTMIILIVMLAIVAIASTIVSKYIAKPITNMVTFIEGTQTESLDEKITEQGFYEVKRLSFAYNNLLGRVTDLMTQVKEEQAELRKAEMKILQAQINPHFLYNTLDSILWMSNRNDNQGAAAMTNALGRLLRISLSKGEHLISLEKELEHAKSYLEIQKIRYDEQFTYAFKVDEGLENCQTVKLIIQPFLENALYHGIERMVDEGHINIRVKDKKDHILIEIADDGAGMTEEKLAQINQPKGLKQSGQGIGISNVNRRLKIYFGEQYGISAESELDEGTCVSIRFPKICDGDFESA